MPKTIESLEMQETKCPICKGKMKYKMFVGTGNVQGWECVPCALIVGNSTLQKLESMFLVEN